MKDIIIIGGGPAGLTAGIYAGRANLSCVILEKMSPGGQAAITNNIQNYPGFESGVDGQQLAEKFKAQAQRFGAEIVQDEVQSVDFSQEIKRVQGQNATYEGRACIVAVGASPRELGIPGERELKGMGVSYCATCDGFFFKGLDVCIVGGGDTAAEDAIFLSKICKKVYLIHRRDTLRAAKSLQNTLEQLDNVELVLEYVPKKIQGKFEVNSIELEHVQTHASRIIECQGVFVAVGQQPQTGFLKDSIAVNQGGYLICDSMMRSSLPGVFCAGDAVEKQVRQIVTAASDGAIAAISAEKYLLGAE